MVFISLELSLLGISEGRLKSDEEAQRTHICKKA